MKKSPNPAFKPLDKEKVRELITLCNAAYDHATKTISNADKERIAKRLNVGVSTLAAYWTKHKRRYKSPRVHKESRAKRGNKLVGESGVLANHVDKFVRDQGVDAIIANNRVLSKTKPGEHYPPVGCTCPIGTFNVCGYHVADCPHWISPRSARADVYPNTTVARTRGSVIVVFDVNASIVDVVNTVTSAWQSAREGTHLYTPPHGDHVYVPGEENARNGTGG